MSTKESAVTTQHTDWLENSPENADQRAEVRLAMTTQHTPDENRQWISQIHALELLAALRELVKAAEADGWDCHAGYRGVVEAARAVIAKVGGTP